MKYLSENENLKGFQSKEDDSKVKVHIFGEGHQTLQNLHRNLTVSIYIEQI